MTDTRPYDASPDDSNTALRLPKVVLPQPASSPVASYVLPWRRIIVNAVVAWVVTRVAYVLLTVVANHLPPQRPTVGSGFFAVWQRWDTNWYISIATQGYHSPPQIAFFPVYPALMRAMSALLGGHILLAGLIVANLGALAALIGMGALAAWETRDARMATYAIVAVLIYPFSFYLTAAYTEGLFLAFTAFSLLFARQGRWRLAAVMALLAGATRPTGAALAPALAWEWLRQQGLLDPQEWSAALRPERMRFARDWLRRLIISLRHDWAGVLAIAAVPAFMVGMVLFIWLRFGHPSLIVNVRRDYWGLVSAPIWKTLFDEVVNTIRGPFGSVFQITMALDLASLAAGAYVVLTRWRRTPFAYTLYMIGLLYLCVAERTSGGIQVLQGPGRYLVGAVPMLLALGDLLERRPRLAVALICVCLAIQCYIALQFLTGIGIE